MMVIPWWSNGGYPIMLIMALWWSLWSWGRDRPYDIILVSFWVLYGGILEAFSGHLDVKNPFGNSIDAPFLSELDLNSSTPPILEDFGGLLGRFLDIDFAIGFHLLLRWLFVDFHTPWTSKSEQIAWEVLQKSNFRVVRYRMCLRIDFGWILELGFRHFWVPIGLQKRLWKQVL